MECGCPNGGGIKNESHDASVILSGSTISTKLRISYQLKNLRRCAICIICISCFYCDYDSEQGDFNKAFVQDLLKFVKKVPGIRFNK